MGRIKKAAGPKHAATISPYLSAFIQRGLNIPVPELPKHLSAFPRRWPFPRGDLYHWIGVLDRFDDILATFIEKYGLSQGPQTKQFGRILLLDSYASAGDGFAGQDAESKLNELGFGPEGDRELVEVLLDFSRLLLEKCGNRSLFNSSDRLNDLLNTTSLSLLQCALRLGVGLAQRYNSRRSSNTNHIQQNLLASHYNIDLERVQKLAAPFPRPVPQEKSAITSAPAPSLKEKEKAPSRRASFSKYNANNILSLTGDTVIPSTAPDSEESGPALNWEEWGHVRMSYYPLGPVEQRHAGMVEESHAAQLSHPVTPTPLRRSHTHPTPKSTRTPTVDDPPAALASSPAGRAEETPRGMKILDVPFSKLVAVGPELVLETSLTDLPEESKYELLHKIRVAYALAKSSETRRLILSIRILAITNLAYVYPDTVFQQKILQQDSDEPKRHQLVYQLAELVHLGASGDINATPLLQAIALNALDALVKQKARSTDVLTALNVNVNHGILMFLARKAVAELGTEDDTMDANETDEWRDALFALLRTLPNSSTRAPETLVAAGLIPLFVDVLNLRTEKARRVYPRVMEFLDTFVHAVRDAFATLASAKGFDAIAELISYEAKSAFVRVSQNQGLPAEHKTQAIDYQIPYFQQQALRWLFKFVNHIMQHGGGGFDRLLRNLVDSPPLLTALKLVFENARIFGSHVWSGAVNILSSFIHNEPTSYGIIAEAGLSKSFLEAIMLRDIDVPETAVPPPDEEMGDASEEQSAEPAAAVTAASSTPTPKQNQRHKLARSGGARIAAGILPSTEAIACIPQAFGAICLNSAGLKLFESTNALDHFFAIFESPDHVKCMKDDANLLRVLGNSFDELVRHHPALKSSIMSSVLLMIARVNILCKSKAWARGAGAKVWVEGDDGKLAVAGGHPSLLGEIGQEFQTEAADQSMPVPPMKDVELPDGGKLIPGDTDVVSQSSNQGVEDDLQDTNGLTVSNYIYTAMKFLNAFFENQTICTYFIEAGGIEFVLDFATLQSLPFNFHGTEASHELATVIHMLAETKPHLVLPSLATRTQAVVNKLEPFWSDSRATGFFSPLTRTAKESDESERAEVLSKGTFFVKHLVAAHTLTDILREVFTQPMYPTRPSQQSSPFAQVNLVDVYSSLAKGLGLLQSACVWEEILLQKNMPESWNEATKIRGFSMHNDEASDILGFLNLDPPPEPPEATDAPATSDTQGQAAASGSNDDRRPEPRTTRSSIASAQQGAAFKNVKTLRYLLSALPSSITGFFHLLGHGLVTKRRMDSYQRQNAFVISDAIASVVLQQLQLKAPSQSDCSQDRFKYLIVILSSLSQLLFESTAERPQSHCLTMILFSFKKFGGLQVLKSISKLFLNEIKTLNPKNGQTAEAENLPARLASALGGMKIILTFFSEMTSARYIMESSQTQSMSSSERDRDRPDYFQPGQFLVELRMEVLPMVREMWSSEFVDLAPSSIVRCLIEILRSVLQGEYETGAFRRSDNPPNVATSAPKTFLVHRERLTSLHDRGYDKDLAKEALYRCNNVLNAAEEYCKAQNWLRCGPRMPIPAHELGPSPRPSNTPHTEGGVLGPLPALSGDRPLATLLGEIAAHPSVAIEETEAEQSDRNRVPESDESNSAGAQAMSIDNLLNDNESSAPDQSGSTQPQHVPETPQRRELVTIDDLDSERERVKENLIERCLDVLNVHHDVTFDLADLIFAATRKFRPGSTGNSYRKEIGETLVQSLISLQMEENFQAAGKKIAAYANLLALVLRDADIYKETLDELRDNFSTLLGFIKVTSPVPEPSTEESFPWIGQVLLVIENVLSDDAQPAHIQWNAPTLESSTNPSQEKPLAELSEPVIPLDEKIQLFEAIVEILPKIGKDDSLALSVLRVLVALTRERKIAAKLGEKRNLQRLFVMVKQLASATNEKLQGAFMLILRHIVEDEDTIRRIMRSEIVSSFESRSSRQTDVSGYVRQFNHLVLRSPQIFVEVTNEKLKLQRYEPQQRPQYLTLKQDKIDRPEIVSDKEDGENQEPDAETSGKETKDKGKAPELKAPVVEHPDGVIHYLLSELLSYKDVDDKEPPAETSEQLAKDQPGVQTDVEMSGQASPASSTSEAPVTRATSKKGEKPQFKADEHPIYIYRCFLLQCLTELLSSYNRTKVEFINFSRRADPLATTPSKPRSGILNYLLNALIPIGTLEHDESVSFKKRSNTSSWAMRVVVALCLKTGEYGGPSRRRSNSEEEEEPELLFVRKFVLEHALRAYRDANTSSESLGAKYARLMCLADLFDKMLSGSSSPDGSVPVPSSTRQIAKTMFEKNFISALTASIADIDLNFPSAKRAVKYILRPLNKLTQTAVLLSETSSIQTTPGQTDEDEISSATSVSDMDEDREETPDLFRHSTLGMFEPTNEDATSSEEESEEDDEMYDDEYGDEMEYEEELAENDGEVISDEDEDGPGPIEGLPGDEGMDIEVLISEEEDDDEDDEDDEDEEEDEEDEEDEDLGMDDEMIAGEITGDNDNDSLQDGEDGEWDSEDMSEDGEMLNQLESELGDITHAGHHHGDVPRFDNLLRALEGAGGAGDDLDMDGDLQGGMMEDDLDEDDDEGDEVDELEEELDEEWDDDQEGSYDFDEDDPSMPMPAGWGFDEGRIARHHHHHPGIQRFRPSPWQILPDGLPSRHDILPLPPYRSRNQGPPRGIDDGTNPLLLRIDRAGDPPPGRTTPGAGALSDWIHAMDPGAAGTRPTSIEGPVSFLNAIMQAMGQGGTGFGVISRPDGIHVHFDRRAMPPSRIQDLFGVTRPAAVTQRSRDDPTQAIAFALGSTSTRWLEEARLLWSSNYQDKAQRVVNSLLRVLVPPAIEEEKERQKKAEEERKRREEERAEKERQDRIAREEAENERKRKEEEEEALRQQQEAEVRAQQASGEGVPEPMDDVQPSEPSAGESAAEAALHTEEAPVGPSEPTPRVRTTIRGRQLDITGMDIDPEYLEALPEDLREEVIMQQLAEQRSQAAASGEEPTEINEEFLEALPPEIREELLQQEAADRRRRQREAARREAAANGNAPQPEDMDAASFIATLDPGLRQAVLADQPEEILAQLDPDIASEGRALAGRNRLAQMTDISRLDHIPRPEATGHDQGMKKQQRRQIVQMLDKSGVATLLRLMFMPLQANARHQLNDILHNVCENRQNRSEVISLLLLILQDGSADVTAIEKSFAHLSLRAKTPATQKTPLPLKRSLSLQGTPHGANTDVTPLMVVQQCLGALSFLTQYNPHIAWYFLTEHETSSALKMKALRKGKGKDSRGNKFAINALLSLLDRKLIMESSNCMEQLSSLLSTITQQLTLLLRKEKEKQEEENKVKDKEAEDAKNAEKEEQPETADDMAMAEGSYPGDETTGEEATQATKIEEPKETEEKSRRQRFEPPAIPEHNLQLVVRILAARECNGKTFRETLSTINNLSAIPGAKETIGKELINQAQDLSQAILVDLTHLLPHIENAQTGTDVQGMALSKFSPASSDQAKLLRVLTALDYLFDPSRADKDRGAEATTKDKEDVLRNLYESSSFGPLWAKLSECLTVVRKNEKVFNVATILLPLIEALMVVCKNTTLKDIPLSRQGREYSVSSPPPDSGTGMETLFFNFTEEHRKILNELVRQNPKLMSGTFSLLVKNPKVLEFDNKRNYFNRRVHSRGTEARHPHPPLQLSVRRDQVFLDSFKSLYFKTAEEMKYGKLSIRFHGEEGVDAGGVTREWFQVLARGMFNPNYALFVPVASDRTTFHPNRLSGVNQEHLMFFKFIGRIIGKALYEGRVLDCHFSRAVYKRILGKSVSIKDMETLDLDYYKSLVWMLENDITDIITETFAIETDDFGETQVIDLIENGRNIPVTEENKEEYVQRVVEHRLTGSVHEQLDHFLRGFHDIIPADLIAIFNEQELELLISGLPEIDVDDWKNNAEYINYSASSPQIQWFWRAVRSFDKEERAKLLQFVTGTSKVPLNGFKELEGMNGVSKFNIHRDYGNKDRLPSSHTCFNQIDLPEYESYETLRQRLYVAMTAGSEYFGFA